MAGWEVCWSCACKMKDVERSTKKIAQCFMLTSGAEAPQCFSFLCRAKALLHPGATPERLKPGGTGAQLRLPAALLGWLENRINGAVDLHSKRLLGGDSVYSLYRELHSAAAGYGVRVMRNRTFRVSTVTKVPAIAQGRNGCGIVVRGERNHFAGFRAGGNVGGNCRGGGGN